MHNVFNIFDESILWIRNYDKILNNLTDYGGIIYKKKHAYFKNVDPCHGFEINCGRF